MKRRDTDRQRWRERERNVIIFCNDTYSLIAENSNMNVGITKSISANALTAGSQNVNAVQIAAHTPNAAPNIFLHFNKAMEKINCFFMEKKKINFYKQK